jgi:hypothetical protein
MIRMGRKGNEMKLLESDKSCNGMIWKVVGGLALAALTAGLIANIPDIKRMIKIHIM